MDIMLEQVAVLQDGKAVRFDRHLNHSPDEVWAALTDPAKVSTWFARLQGSVTKNGKISFHFDSTSGTVVEAVVTQLEKPKVFEYHWQRQQEPTPAELKKIAADGGGTCGGKILDLTGNVIRFTIASNPGGSTLTLQHNLSASSHASTAAKPAASEQPQLLASWHNHMDALGAFLSQSKLHSAAAAAPEKMGWQWDKFNQLVDRYTQALA